MANVLWEFGEFALTKFGLWIALGAVLWYVSARVMRALYYKKSVPAGAVSLSGFVMLPLGLAFSRLTYCAANFDRFFAGGFSADVLRFWEGGLSLGGAYVGAFAGICLAAGIARVKVGKLANCFGPGVVWFFLCAVMARAMIGEGWGKLAEHEGSMVGWFFQNESFVKKILFVQDRYGDCRYNVQGIELALGGIVAFCTLFGLRRRKLMPFYKWITGIGSYAAITVFTQSMREGAVLRVEFFRIEQVIALAILLAIGVCALARYGFYREMAWPGAMWLGSAAACVVMEFLVDREGGMNAKYVFMALMALFCLSGAACLCDPEGNKKAFGKKAEEAEKDAL